MSDQTYNGWTNYETWLVKLWQDNDQGEQRFWQEQAEECVREYGDGAKGRLAEGMENHYKEASYDLAGVTGFWADLMGAALCSVNWYEIAQSWVDEVETEETETADSTTT